MSFKNFKKYIIILLIIILIVGLVTFRIKYKSKNKISSNNIKEKITKIGELAGVNYNYTDVLSYKNRREVRGINIPIMEKGFIIKYKGYLKAGVDMDSFKITINDKDSIDVEMGRGKILENVIIEEEVEVLDEKDGLFNKLKFEDLYDILIEEKTKNETKLINEGLLKEAEDNIEEILISLLEEIGFKEIIIEFN